MSSIFTLIPPHWIEAIGWTLVHSLWQGLLIGALAWIVLYALRNFSSRIRYRVAFTALLLIPVLATVTFFRVYESPVAQNTLPDGQLLYMYDHLVTGQISPAENSFNWMALMPWVVVAWLAGAAFFLLRFAGGFIFVQRLRFGAHSKLPFHVQANLNNWMRELRINSKVRIAESANIHAPVLIGYIRPIILLPLGCAAGLPKEQLEALLVHELAHVLRHDFLLNVIQEMVRMLFFFHPVTWWLNKIIRDEREICCDDIAVRSGIEKIHLASALASLEERNMANGELVLAATGRNNLLLRIRRMFRTETVPTQRERAGASVLLLAGLLLVTTSVSLAQAYKEKQEKQEQESAAAADAEDDNDGDGDTTKTSSKKSKKSRKDPPAPPAPPLPPLPPIPPPAPFSPLNDALYFPAPKTPMIYAWPDSPDNYARILGDTLNNKNIVISRDEKGRISEILIDGKPADLRKIDTVALNKLHRNQLAMETYWKQNEKQWLDYEKDMEKYAKEMEQYYKLNKLSSSDFSNDNLINLGNLPGIIHEPLAIAGFLEGLTIPPLHGFHMEEAQLRELEAMRAFHDAEEISNAKIDSLRNLLYAEIELERSRQQNAIDEKEKAELEREKAYERRNTALRNALESEMLNDKLTDGKKKYQIKITKKELEINKKKQDPVLHQKYLAIVEKVMGTLSDDDTFYFSNNYRD